jgi:tetratricopeptide (TPR) repeat protein
VTAIRGGPAALLLALAACGSRAGFERPDYASEAQARCDQAEGESDPSRALALYGLALEADPTLPRAHLGRAKALEAAGRWVEAERSFSMAVDGAREDRKARYHLERARYQLRRGRTETAVRDLDRAVTLFTTWPEPGLVVEARLARAECRIALRAWSGAAEDLKSAFAAGPDAGQRERARAMQFRVDAALKEDSR